MQQTTKYKLNKPDGTDVADIAVLNENADKTEAALITLGVTPETAALCGLSGEVLPDDVLKTIERQMFGVGGTKGIVHLTVKFSDGAPASFMEIFISGGIPTKKYITDANGLVVVDTSTETTTFSISTDYADLAMTPLVLSTPYNKVTVCLLTIELVNFKKFTSSCNIKFSQAVKAVSFSVTGGGGGGGGDNQSYRQGGGGGGGGGATSLGTHIPVKDVVCPCVIGAGGIGSGLDTNGGIGGTTSFSGVTAVGGNGALKVAADGINGGIGGGGSGGKGGNGSTKSGAASTPGQNGSVLGYSSFTETTPYGGGGGGGGAYNVSTGALSREGSAGGMYGGLGVTATSAFLDGGAAQDGGGGGGGGAPQTSANNGNTLYYGKGGKGGNGCLALRMVFE